MHIRRSVQKSKSWSLSPSKASISGQSNSPQARARQRSAGRSKQLVLGSCPARLDEQHQQPTSQRSPLAAVNPPNIEPLVHVAEISAGSAGATRSGSGKLISQHAEGQGQPAIRSQVPAEQGPLLAQHGNVAPAKSLHVSQLEIESQQGAISQPFVCHPAAAPGPVNKSACQPEGEETGQASLPRITSLDVAELELSDEHEHCLGTEAAPGSMHEGAATSAGRSAGADAGITDPQPVPRKSAGGKVAPAEIIQQPSDAGTPQEAREPLSAPGKPSQAGPGTISPVVQHSQPGGGAAPTVVEAEVEPDAVVPTAAISPVQATELLEHSELPAGLTKQAVGAPLPHQDQKLMTGECHSCARSAVVA